MTGSIQYIFQIKCIRTIIHDESFESSAMPFADRERSAEMTDTPPVHREPCNMAACLPTTTPLGPGHKAYANLDLCIQPGFPYYHDGRERVHKPDLKSR